MSETESLMVAVAVALAVLSVLWLVWRRRSPGQRELIAGAMFVLGLALAMLGFWQNPISDCGERDLASPPWLRFLDAAHSSFQLMVLNVDAQDAKSPYLVAARILLPLVTAQVVLLVIAARASQLLLHIRMSAPVFTFDVVVLGCGETGRRVAEWYRRKAGAKLTLFERLWRERSVVGVDRDLTSASAIVFRRSFPMIEAELESEDGLRALRLHRRQLIVICTGDDAKDLELARRIVSIDKVNRRLLPIPGLDDQANSKPDSLGSRPKKPPLKIAVSIESAAMARACMFDDKLKPWYADGQLELLNAAHAAARLMLLRYGPHELHGDRFRVREDNPCHIAICGDGPMIDELVAQATRALVYSFENPLRITVLTPHAAQRQAEFYGRHPALSPAARASNDDAYGARLSVADIEFVESWPEQINVHDLRRADARQRIDAIYTAGKHPAEASLVAAEAIKASHVLPARPPVVALVEGHDDKRWRPQEYSRVAIKLFELDPWWPPDGVPEHADDGPPNPDDYGDQVSKHLWWHYKGITKDPRREELWEKLDQSEKWNNRYAADHAQIKLRLLGVPLNASASTVSAEVTRHIEWLMRLEHRRFACERMTDGWVRMPETESKAPETKDKIVEFHLNYTLTAFDLLPKDEREKDAAISNLTGVLVDLLGLMERRINLSKAKPS